MKRTHVFSFILFISLVAIFFVGCGERTVIENSPDNVLVDQYEGIKTLPDPDLASLVLTNSGSSAVSYTPSFDKDTTTYTATVANGVSTISFLATTSHSSATMTINGTATSSGAVSTPLALSVGVNNFALAVTAQDGGTVKTYNVNVTRAGGTASSDNTLSNLVLSPTNITSFSSGTTSYSFTVASDVTSVNVTPTANHGAATITVNGTSVTSGNSQAVSLSAGANTINVIVTAEDASTRTYTVTVTRDAASITSLLITEWADAGTNLDYIEIRNFGTAPVTVDANFSIIYGSSAGTTVTLTAYGTGDNPTNYTPIGGGVSIGPGEIFIVVEDNVTQTDIQTIMGYGSGVPAGTKFFVSTEGTLVGSNDRLSDNPAKLKYNATEWSITPPAADFTANVGFSTYSKLNTGFTLGVDSTSDYTKWSNGTSTIRNPGVWP